MGRWLCQRKLNHLFHPDLALLPLANDAKLSKEAINLGGTHRNGMQSIVKAHGQALGVQENLKETISKKPVLGWLVNCSALPNVPQRKHVMPCGVSVDTRAPRKSLKFA